MHLKTLYFTILPLFFLQSCGNNSLHYIKNDNYNKNYQYYLQNFKSNSYNYKLITIFNDKSSYINTKKIISDMKKKYINKYTICVVILCPTVLSKEQNISIFFNYVKDLYTFLTSKKNFTNQLYVLGIPSPNLDKYECIIYFVSLS